MAAIIGLPDTNTFVNERFNNHRRMVFYNYPAGAAPLTGLMSLLKEEETDDPKFVWWEKRLEEMWGTATNISSTIVFYKTVTGLASTTYASGTGTWTTANGDISPAAGTIYGIKIASGEAEKFRAGMTILMKVYDTSGNVQDLMGVIPENGVDGANDRIAFQVAADPGFDIDYDNAGNASQYVFIIGSSAEEAATDTSVTRYNKPTEHYNTCQIHRTPFSISGTKLNTSVKYDDTGVYKDLAKERSVEHMIGLEKTFIWGQRGTDSSGDNVRYTSGGILSFLRLWEAGSDYGNTAATADTDDNKRIIENSTGVMTEKLYDQLVERSFRITNNKVNEKLVLCGSGFLMVMNQLYRSKAQLTSGLPFSDTYGMDVVKHVSSFGTLYYRTHPLFSQHPTLRYCALVVDVHNLKYRYVTGRDTELLTNRQANDADYRKDEWLTECGLEIQYPESFMYIKNVQNYS
jgi:hypothetical protein